MRSARRTGLLVATLLSFATTFGVADLDPCAHHDQPAAPGSAGHAGHGQPDTQSPEEGRPCSCPGPCSVVSPPVLPGTMLSARTAPILTVVSPPAPATRIPKPPIAFLLPWPNAPPAA